MRKLTASEKSARARFVHCSSIMENAKSYEDNYFNDVIASEGIMCNNDCYNCMLECPYK